MADVRIRPMTLEDTDLIVKLLEGMYPELLDKKPKKVK